VEKGSLPKWILEGRIRIPIWDATIFVRKNNDLIEAGKEFGLTLREEVKASNALVTWKTNDLGSMRWYLLYDDSTVLCDIVHECGHLAGRILHNRDVHPCFDNDEAFCYLLGYIFKKVHKIYKYNKKKK
jgi:hypothetical protein